MAKAGRTLGLISRCWAVREICKMATLFINQVLLVSLKQLKLFRVIGIQSVVVRCCALVLYAACQFPLKVSRYLCILVPNKQSVISPTSL